MYPKGTLSHDTLRTPNSRLCGIIRSGSLWGNWRSVTLYQVQLLITPPIILKSENRSNSNENTAGNKNHHNDKSNSNVP